MSALTSKTRADIPRVTVPPGQQVLGRDLAQLRDSVQKWGDLLPFAGCGFSAVSLDPITFLPSGTALAIPFTLTTLDTHGWSNTFQTQLDKRYIVPEGAGGVYVCSWQAQFKRTAGAGDLWYGLRIKQSPRFPNRGGRNEWTTFAKFSSAAPGDMQTRTSIETLYPGDMLSMEYIMVDGATTFVASVDSVAPPIPVGPSRGLEVWRIGQPIMPMDGTIRGSFTDSVALYTDWRGLSAAPTGWTVDGGGVPTYGVAGAVGEISSGTAWTTVPLVGVDEWTVIIHAKDLLNQTAQIGISASTAFSMTGPFVLTYAMRYAGGDPGGGNIQMYGTGGTAFNTFNTYAPGNSEQWLAARFKRNDHSTISVAETGHAVTHQTQVTNPTFAAGGPYKAHVISGTHIGYGTSATIVQTYVTNRVMTDPEVVAMFTSMGWV